MSELCVYGTDRQGTGAFDGGKITETKPIGFPGEGSDVSRIGPLFYWAWASSNGPATIALHPHQGFEIISYVMQGEIGHRDTLGNTRSVKSGGLQVMQTGSGVSHEEVMLGERNDFFQIWFEPELREAVQRPATYADFEVDALPVTQHPGARVTNVLGPAAPFQLVADVDVTNVELAPSARFDLSLRSGRSLAAVTIEGHVQWHAGSQSVTATARDFVVVEATEDETVTLRTENRARVLVVDVPTRVDYPLY